MDKAQKELIKSYFHARNIGVEAGMGEMGEFAKYKEYEFGKSLQFIKNGLVKTFDNKTLRILLQKKPEIVEYAKEHLNKLTGVDIFLILIKNPQIVEYFDENDFKKLINSVKNHGIVQVDVLLLSNKKILNHFKNKFSELNAEELEKIDVSNILATNPDYIKYFNIHALNELEPISINYILIHGDSNLLGKYFKEAFLKYDERSEEYLLAYRPHLKKYFNNG